MNIAVLVCNNGLGHIKRVLTVANEILKKDVNFYFKIFVDIRKLKYVKEVISFKSNDKIKFVNFDHNVIEYETHFISEFRSEIINSDFVWSDNLSFPVELNHRFVLTGSFLWSEILDGSYKLTEIARLKERRPTMIGSSLFSAAIVKKLTKYHGVGLFRYNARRSHKTNNTAILISSGKSYSGLKYFQNMIDDISKLAEEFFSKYPIYIEPALYDLLDNKGNFIEAKYTSEMYDEIKVAIIRPGMGTISELWSREIKIFPLFESDNNELQRNSKIIRDVQGDTFNIDLEQTFKKASQYLIDKTLQARCKKDLKSLEFDGIQSTANRLIKVFKH